MIITTLNVYRRFTRLDYHFTISFIILFRKILPSDFNNVKTELHVIYSSHIRKWLLDLYLAPLQAHPTQEEVSAQRGKSPLQQKFFSMSQLP